MRPSAMHSKKRDEPLQLPPVPYVLSDSGVFDGNDGKWSSFLLNIGDDGSGRGQNFRVLISTSSPVVLVPGQTEWCDDDECAKKRGLELYDGKQPLGLQDSAQWQASEIYNVPQPYWWSDSYRIDQSDLNGLWGVDNVALGASSPKSFILAEQYVVRTLVKDFFMGSFGLAVGAVGPPGGDKPNFLDNFEAANKIASRSYGYTAGAYYRNNNNGVPGSLVLGGYDESRFKPKGTSIRMPNDKNNALVVGVQSILYAMDQDVETNTVRLTPSGGFSATIDSTLPYLILPDEVCDEFVSKFRLEFDEDSQLFLVNSTSHQANQRENATVSFKIGASPSDSDIFTSIVLPYVAFDQQASFPLPVPNESNQYFPIKRSENGVFVLGRTFLQEAYIIVDYERTNFTVAPALFADPMPTQSLVTIFNESYTRLPSVANDDSEGGLPTGAIARIVVGIVIVFALAAIGVFIWWKRRNPKKDGIESERPLEIDTTHAGTEVKYRRVSELTGSEGPQSPRGSSLGYYGPDHKSIPPICEMSPDSPPSELYSPPPEGHDGVDYFASAEARRQGAMRDRRSPGMSTTQTPTIAELPGEGITYETSADESKPTQRPRHSRSPSDSSLGTNIDAVLANERMARPRNGSDVNDAAVEPYSPNTVEEEAGVKTVGPDEDHGPAEQSAVERRPSHSRGLSDTTIQSESTAVSQPTQEELDRWARTGEVVQRPMSP
ncbi:hypothetical protein GGP41_003696 [Bipolaris sorokiniana]|uniref:Peptidase A1 domain-containing protein n=2 Tax=Cochliobolus sativus TaxID=45130 RepID=A0A8H6DTW6_COCSA|nr:uncharacterized protein COCSADRAFT_190030 [Bipolaris sorokiniana ND90Pr]EMD65048.1 hypothetical protein COCSADRAFT_190030 [Bipolaris sorokiniana ND90Pr]KAF5846225.1 hypothetical protein GGP41_003696 [Bipolaris sorokiniana]